jgi:hypothetical protein
MIHGIEGLSACEPMLARVTDAVCHDSRVVHSERTVQNFPTPGTLPNHRERSSTTIGVTGNTLIQLSGGRCPLSD